MIFKTQTKLYRKKESKKVVSKVVKMAGILLFVSIVQNIVEFSFNSNFQWWCKSIKRQDLIIAQGLRTQGEYQSGF